MVVPKKRSNFRGGKRSSNQQAMKGKQAVPTQQRGEGDLHTKLERIEKRSRADRDAMFNNLGHLINLEMLRRCFHSLDGSKAVGADGMTKEKYERNLEPNLERLLAGIRRGSYHPQPARLVEIAKSDGTMRPLAISCFEDKIVQEATRSVLERIYEPIFLDCSHGFRPKRSCQTALVALDAQLKWQASGAVLEIDLQKCFNTIPHAPLIEWLRLKIADNRFLHLIIKQLKAPILNAEGKPERSEIGSPQGSILSPLLANVYLHYVIDTWFTWVNGAYFDGAANLVRYADDGVFTFKSMAAAERFLSSLRKRLEKYGIRLHEGKTKVIVSGSREAALRNMRGEQMPSFTFLGFTHYWGKAWNRKLRLEFWRVKRRTCSIRFRKKLLAIKEFIRANRQKKDLMTRVLRILRGYLNYFAVNDNSKRVSQFNNEVRRMLFKYLNRRSQRCSMDWQEFRNIVKKIGYPENVKLRNLFFISNTSGTKPGGCW